VSIAPLNSAMRIATGNRYDENRKEIILVFSRFENQKIKVLDIFKKIKNLKDFLFF
jgi:hypothetical protein